MEQILLRHLQATTSITHKEEFLPVYELQPTLSSKEPPRLTPNRSIDSHAKRFVLIDVAHRNGYVHSGSALYIMDSSGLLLFLQRSTNLVTCPNTWSLLGEHSTVGEGGDGNGSTRVRRGTWFCCNWQSQIQLFK